MESSETAKARQQHANVKSSQSFSARAEETRRAFLDQLQQRTSVQQQHNGNNYNNSGNQMTMNRRQEAVFIAEF